MNIFRILWDDPDDPDGNVQHIAEHGLEIEDVEEVLGRLTDLEPDPWGREWGKIGARYESFGTAQEQQGKKDDAAKTYYQAYEYYRIGRYPVPSSPEKMNCYKGALRTFLKAAPYLDPPLERIEIPFEGNVNFLKLPADMD